MIYLNIHDLKNKVGEETISQLTEGDDTILDNFEMEAIGIVKEYLSNTYDIDTEISLSQRNIALVGYIAYIVIYLLFQRVPDSQVPERIIKNYDDTIETLSDLSKGKRQSNITKYLTIENQPKTIFRWNSLPKRSH